MKSLALHLNKKKKKETVYRNTNCPRSLHNMEFPFVFQHRFPASRVVTTATWSQSWRIAAVSITRFILQARCTMCTTSHRTEVFSVTLKRAGERTSRPKSPAAKAASFENIGTAKPLNRTICRKYPANARLTGIKYIMRNLLVCTHIQKYAYMYTYTEQPNVWRQTAKRCFRKSIISSRGRSAHVASKKHIGTVCTCIPASKAHINSLGKTYDA